ncbi:hypothetical protein BLS_006059 [Venturia inaequalis]|uniref:Uncharacterized protein n=1 Tax=Venturia inaequalis TaxID=5025 RepID=A0A8H3YQ94_VENIN|nr:hypothetical protein BLS_006059 [Venturia inaequalis]
MQAFKGKTCRSAFEKTGIVPFDPLKVIEKCPPTITATPPPRETTPPPIDWENFPIPKSARSLARLGQRVYDLDLPGNEDVYAEALDKFMMALTSIALAADIQQKQLFRARASEMERQRHREDARKQLDVPGPLNSATARAMVVKKREISLAEDEARVARRREREIKRQQKENEAAAIAHRKAVRAQNKILGIKTPRYRRNAP